MAGLSHEPESKGCIEETIAVEEIHASTHHGALDLFLEVVVDAEALEVIDGDHHLPVVLLTLMENLFYFRQALLQVYVSWRVVSIRGYVSMRNIYNHEK
jgi:hypothetical protein